MGQKLIPLPDRFFGHQRPTAIGLGPQNKKLFISKPQRRRYSHFAEERETSQKETKWTIYHLFEGVDKSY